MIREIGYAHESVSACVYEMGNPVITKIFSDAAARGVEVTILIEGQPVTGLSNASKTAISTLVSSGCDVRMITSNQSYRRYDCLHAKYLVTDGERVTVMSENWAGGLVSNRGWGVTVVSEGLAGDVIDMFLQDSSLERRDVKEASTAIKDWYSPPAEHRCPPAWRKCRCADGRRRLPDSLSGHIHARPSSICISSATKRLLVEQLYIDPAWVEKQPDNGRTGGRSRQGGPGAGAAGPDVRGYLRYPQ